MKRFLLAFLFILPLVLSAAVLVENGQTNAEILLPAQPNRVEQLAATELAEHLRLLSGVTIPVRTGEASTAEVAIRLGRAAKLSLIGYPANAGHILIEGNTIDIVGVDGDGDPLEMATPAGTLFAVYEFLEKLGVRWLWPGDLGTYVPKLTTIALEVTDRPVFLSLPNTDWRYTFTANWPDQEMAKAFLQREKVWLRRHRFTEVSSLGYGHAFTKWYGEYGTSHPEYFNLLPDGTRRPDPISPHPNRADLVSMCVSNPELTKQIIDDWVEKGTPPIINLNENDTAGKCTCPACLSADGSTDADRLARAAKSFADGNLYWFRELGSVSGRYAHWFLDVLAAADKVAPEANAKVISGIYANYFEPPVGVQLNERVLMRFCPPVMYPWTPEKVANFKRLWKGWTDAGARLMLRPNFTLDGHGFPLLYYRDYVDCFNFIHAHGMIGADLDSLTGMYGANGLTTYVIASKFSRPEASADQLMEEYLLAFGPASPAVREYLALMENATHNVEATEDPSIEGGRYADFYMVAEKIFTPEVMHRGSELLNEAARLAREDAIAAARVQFLGMAFFDASCVLATQKGFEEFEKSGNPNSFALALKQLQSFRSANADAGYANIGFLNYLEGRRWPLHLALLGNDSRELTGWEIRFDPKRDGEDVGCIEGQGHGWQPIVLDKHWELSEPGKAWEKEHNAPHKGVAWYRCQFEVRNVNPAQQLKLTFGAVDGIADFWLNGKHIFTREFPYQGDWDSWKKPFDVDSNGNIQEGKNLLVVRVDKRENGMSGIWRPVYLSMGQVTAENLPAEGWKPHAPAGKIAFQTKSYPLTIIGNEIDNT